MPRIMATNTNVESLIRGFADQLQAVIREQLSQEITSAVQAALGGPSTRVKNATKAVPAPKAAKATGKRSPEEIEKLAAQLLSYISKNPEQRSEQIAQATNLTTGELVLPIKRLLAEKAIKAKGKARGTTYTAGK